MTMPMPGVSRLLGEKNYLAKLIHRGHLKHYPTNAGWNTGHSGSGGGAQEVAELYLTTGATGSSVSLFSAYGYGLARGTTERNLINWDKELWLWANLTRQLAGDDNTKARIQLKEATTEGVLAAKGIGVQITNLTLVGESYGTGLATTGSFGMTILNELTIAFHHLPGASIEWFYGNTYPLTSLGKTTTAANIPSGESSTGGNLVVSIINGATAENRNIYVSDIWLWQA